jgi:hypothetical protein
MGVGFCKENYLRRDKLTLRYYRRNYLSTPNPMLLSLSPAGINVSIPWEKNMGSKTGGRPMACPG